MSSGHKPTTDDPWQQVHDAVEDLRRRANLQRSTGYASVRINLNEGGVTKVTKTLEEQHRPQ